MDLITTAFQVPQHSAQAGENLLVLFNIENVTDTLIEEVGITFYLSHNSWISTGDYELGSLDLGNIEGQTQSGVQRVNLLFPPESDDFWAEEEDGTYFIGALIDNNNAIDLGSSAAYRQFMTHDAVKITELNMSDLRGDHFSVSNFERQADGSILASIDFSVLNQGDGLADEFLVDFYISDETDNRQHPISANDYFIGSYKVDGLDSGSSTGILTTELNIPHTSDGFWEGSGYYSLGMMINDAGNAHESRRFDNNSNQREGLDYSINTIADESWVDLYGINFNVRQENVALYEPGQNLTIDYAIRNGGLGFLSQDFNLDFYVSTDPDINTDDFLIGSDRFTDDLAAGAYGKGTADFILPNGFPPLILPDDSSPLDKGRYYVGVIIDGANEVPENNEANNRSTRELFDYDGTGGDLDAKRNTVPDLTNTYFNITSGSNRAGENVNVELSAANLSPADAAPFSVGIYLSHNEYISTNDVLIGTYDFTTGLAAYGDTGIVPHSVTLPDQNHEFWKTKGNGTYFIGTIVDPENAHAEYTELNNANLGYKLDSDTYAISGLTFTDLVSGSFIANPADGDNRIAPGELVSIDYQVANQEGLGAGPFKVDFYLSSNDYISSNDVFIGSQQIDNLNGFTATDILNGTFQLPDASNEIWSNFDGTYYVGMMIDPAHQVNELSHLNNQNQGQFLDSDTVEVVGTTNRPDDPNPPEMGTDLISAGFRITDDVSEANPLEAGEEFQVEYSVLNAGGGYTPFFANEFFLVERHVLDNLNNLSPDDVDNNTIYGAFGDQGSALIQLGPHDYTGDKYVTLKVPNVAAGHYTLVMQTDVFEEVYETNEFNNIAHIDVYIDSSGDLVNEHLSIVEDVSEENPFQPGEFFTAEYEVVNQGGEDIPFFATHFYLLTPEFVNQNFTIDFSDIEYNVPSFDPLFTDPYPLYGDFFSEVISLGEGESTGRQQITLQVPEDITAGRYFLGIESDVFDEVDEPNEFNNSLFDITEDYVELYIGDGTAVI